MPVSVYCSACGGNETAVLQSRKIKRDLLPFPYYRNCGSMRRHVCLRCSHRWTTHEISTAALAALNLILTNQPQRDEDLAELLSLNSGAKND